MTAVQKKTDNPIARVTPEDIEELGAELDAIRQSVLNSRGASDAAYIRKVITAQRKLKLASRIVLLVSMFPPALAVGTNDSDGERDGQPGPQRLDPLGHHVRSLPRRCRDLREAIHRRREPRRVVYPTDARIREHQRKQGHALHDRRPFTPDRAPPIPRPAVQPVRGDRPQVRALFEKYELTYVSGSMPRQVASAWEKVIRLSLPNDFAEQTQAAVLDFRRPESKFAKSEAA